MADNDTYKDQGYLEYIDNVGGLERLKSQMEAKNADARKAWISFMQELGPHLDALDANPSWQYIRSNILAKKKRQLERNFLAVNFLEPEAVKQALIYKYMIAGIDVVLGTLDFYRKTIETAKWKAKETRKKRARKAAEEPG